LRLALRATDLVSERNVSFLKEKKKNFLSVRCSRSQADASARATVSAVYEKVRPHSLPRSGTTAVFFFYLKKKMVQKLLVTNMRQMDAFVARIAGQINARAGQANYYSDQFKNGTSSAYYFV